ncbi:MAG: bacillithiol biosynthesis deacetylase BshB1 [Ignavibacteriae bacterium HGW-Ignavibacteriae-3]|nr:MAG: bacillithiol biosynthesis deacetylase BshB1 [Ignavibacteriae bacterium HGW-Ignavibacteriae-3]
MNLDVLIFAAHPDDAELSMGGTIALMTLAGLKTGVVDLSRGELGTRGSSETRKQEAAKAGEILKLSHRENLGLKDGSLKFNEEYLKKIVSKIRKHQPKIIFAPYFNDRHPDHIGTSQLVKEAMFFSGLAKITTEENDRIQAPFRPQKLYYYMQTYEFKPSFIVDITKTFDIKMNAIEAFDTQFHNPESKEPETFISQPAFLKFIEARARYFGFKIGREYGEAFFSEEEIEFDLIGVVRR